MAISRAVYGHMLDHVILPRKLSSATTELLPQTEVELLENFIDTFRVFHETDIIPDVTKHLFKNLKTLHGRCAKLDQKTIAEQIDALEPGQIFGMYVREQNCAILVYAPPDNTDDQWILSTFHPSLPNAVISGNRSDVQVSIE